MGSGHLPTSPMRMGALRLAKKLPKASRSGSGPTCISDAGGGAVSKGHQNGRQLDCQNGGGTQQLWLCCCLDSCDRLFQSLLGFWGKVHGKKRSQLAIRSPGGLPFGILATFRICAIWEKKRVSDLFGHSTEEVLYTH